MFVSIAIAAAHFGVSTSTMRRWERQGRLAPAKRTLGGHRRYSLEQLSPSSSDSSERKTILYSRVSGSDQKEDLIRQQEKLKTYATQRGWDAELISDLGSGLRFKKRGLQKLIRLILAGKVERIVLTHKDRLLRFGNELVFQLCENFNTEVVVMESAPPQSFEEELACDVVALMTVFCSRLYGRRSHQARKQAA